MDLTTVLAIAALGAGIYFYKRNSDDSTEQELDNQDYIDELLDEIEELEYKINPNGNAHQAPVTMSCTVKMGGITLNQLEIWLNIRNNSDSQIELGDFRSRLFVGGIRSERVMPSNISHYIIPARETIRVRLYARDNMAFPNNYNEVRRALASMSGNTGTKLPNNTVIPVSKEPVSLDMQYIWYWKGGEDECVSYNVLGEFVYKYAGWTVGSFEGYNAGRENQQKANPSYWQKYDTQEIDE